MIMDGETLDPKKIFDSRHDRRHPGVSPRAARRRDRRIAWSDPKWIVNIKETGKIMLVNYQDIDNLQITDDRRCAFPARWRLGHQQAVLPDGRQSVQQDRAVIDSKTVKLIKLIDVEKIPHPGRGANFLDPKFGPVWVTSALGNADITLIGTDPEKHPEHAWSVVRTLKGQGRRIKLFVKTHPKSKHLYVDSPLNPDVKISQSWSRCTTSTISTAATRCYRLPTGLSLAVAEAGRTSGVQQARR